MRFFLTLALCLFLAACSTLEENIQIFESERLVGAYDVDMSPVLSKLKTTDEDDGFTRFGKGLASLALSNMECKMRFYPGNRCEMEFGGYLFNWFKAPADSNNNPVAAFTYKVVQDSILYMKGEDDVDFDKWGVVRKFNDDYSALQFLVFSEEGEKEVLFNLKKSK